MGLRAVGPGQDQLPPNLPWRDLRPEGPARARGGAMPHPLGRCTTRDRHDGRFFASQRTNVTAAGRRRTLVGPTSVETASSQTRSRGPWLRRPATLGRGSWTNLRDTARRPTSAYPGLRGRPRLTGRRLLPQLRPSPTTAGTCGYEETVLALDPDGLSGSERVRRSPYTPRDKHGADQRHATAR